MRASAKGRFSCCQLTQICVNNKSESLKSLRSSKFENQKYCVEIAVTSHEFKIILGMWDHSETYKSLTKLSLPLGGYALRLLHLYLRIVDRTLYKLQSGRVPNLSQGLGIQNLKD